MDEPLISLNLGSVGLPMVVLFIPVRAETPGPPLLLLGGGAADDRDKSDPVTFGPLLDVPLDVPTPVEAGIEDDTTTPPAVAGPGPPKLCMAPGPRPPLKNCGRFRFGGGGCVMEAIVGTAAPDAELDRVPPPVAFAALGIVFEVLAVVVLMLDVPLPAVAGGPLKDPCR